jgi:hypothetical protein
VNKPLTKVWKCPTCDVGFKASQSIVDGSIGRQCPAGHFHSQYELKRHEEGKPIRTGWKDLKKGKHYGEKPMVAVPRAVGGNKAEMLALLWVGVMDGLLAQLPAGSLARSLVEGATAQAYRVSQLVIDGPQSAAERKVA